MERASLRALVFVAMMALLLKAPAAPIGLPGCNTTCGNLRVPYPMGIEPGCYRPGFNLTCDTNHHGSPQLLLGDGSLRVVNIYPQNATIRVVHDGSMIKGADNITSHGLSIKLTSILADGPYRVAALDNELVLFGCEVLATLLAGKIRVADDSSPTVVGCISFCSTGRRFGSDPSCSGEGCCQASYHGIDWYHKPTELQLKAVQSRNNSDHYPSHVSVFLAEKGWLEKWGQVRLPEEYEPKNDIPLLLRWDIMQGLTLSESDEQRDPYDKYQVCPSSVARLCKSNKSECTWDIEVYQCQCKLGYDGNPYVDSGCQDIDECNQPRENGCFGDCTNTDGSFECRCPSGTFGDPTIRDGCVKTAYSSSAEADVLQAPAPIGLPKCETTCGHMQVPYPFGFGPSECYLPRFNLTCDKGHNPPRLLLGGSNSTLEVVGIFLNDSTVRVIHTTTFDIYTSTDKEELDSRPLRYQDDDKQVGIRFPDIGPFMLAAERNEFILTGCNVEATLLASTGESISSCVSNCTSKVIGDDSAHTGNEYCSGRDGCCHVRIPPGSRPKKVTFKLLLNPNSSQYILQPPVAFVAEDGQIDLWHMIFSRSATYIETRNGSWTRDPLAGSQYMVSKVPLVLQWVLNENISNSAQSDCWRKNGGYMCRCKDGFYGNPYIIGGCQDIDECKIPTIHNACYGDCNNLQGTYKCQCPRGTHGDPNKKGGCVQSLKASTIGLIAASGPALMLLAFGVIFALRKVKHRRKKLLRLQYFKQNRGQLLQQLVSQRTDIAERMIITVDELANATNNFDKARELGGGGHGTVYKGILSDQHVVAIKRSKITVQKEINEFINEVAILSQVNHRNVVKLLGCCLETEVPLLVYEFISNGTLYHHLHVEGPVPLPWNDRLRIAKETANALAYLHSSVSVPIIHRDIKSSNILLDHALTAKVSDFGASRYIPVEKTGLTTVVQGTIGYLDPMCFYTGRLNEKSDVYSFGVILVELLTRKKPFSYLSCNGDSLVMHFVNLHAKGNLCEILDPQLQEESKEIEEVATLAALCIKMTGDERPTMRQVEHTLEGLQESMNSTKGNNAKLTEFEENDKVSRGNQSS